MIALAIDNTALLAQPHERARDANITARRTMQEHASMAATLRASAAIAPHADQARLLHDANLHDVNAMMTRDALRRLRNTRVGRDWA